MLAEALQDYKIKISTQVRKCVVGEWSDHLSEEDQVLLEEALNDASIPNRALLQIFRTVGATYSVEALRRHRTEACACLL